MALHIYFFFCELLCILGKDGRLVFHCLLHGLEFCLPLDWLPLMARESSLCWYLNHRKSVGKLTYLSHEHLYKSKLTKNLKSTWQFHFLHRYLLFQSAVQAYPFVSRREKNAKWYEQKATAMIKLPFHLIANSAMHFFLDKGQLS